MKGTRMTRYRRAGLQRGRIELRQLLRNPKELSAT